MTTNELTGTRPPERTAMPFSRRNKAGFVLAGLLALIDLPSVLTSTPEGEVGPPFPVLVVSTLCGIATLAALAYGWARRNRASIRVAAGTRILSMLVALPALFVDGLPAFIRIAAAAFVLVTIACVVLMLTPAQATSHRAATV